MNFMLSLIAYCLDSSLPAKILILFNINPTFNVDLFISKALWFGREYFALGAYESGFKLAILLSFNKGLSLRFIKRL